LQAEPTGGGAAGSDGTTIVTRRKRDGAGEAWEATRSDGPRPEDAGGESSALLELERGMPYRLSIAGSRIARSPAPIAAMERKGLLDRAIDPHDWRASRLAPCDLAGRAAGAREVS
jgi:hypothetical protein